MDESKSSLKAIWRVSEPSARLPDSLLPLNKVMSSMKDLTQIDLTRQDMLSIWLKRQGKSQADIARALEVGEVSVSRLMRASSIPVRRHEQLLKLGIPAELLPPPLDITPGPKRKDIK